MPTQPDMVEAMSIKPDDVIVVSFPGHLTPDQRTSVNEWAKASLPANNIVIMEAGASISILGHDEHMARIESKLDMLLDALAEDDPEQEPGVDLDGNDVGGERDEGETL